MAGETALARLIASLDPVLDPREFGYATVASGTVLPPEFRPLGTFEEDEGLTVIAPLADLTAARIATLAAGRASP